MKLTPFGKLFLALVVVGVVGLVVFRRYGDEIRAWAGQGAGKVEVVTKEDFESIGELPDPPRGAPAQVKPQDASKPVGGGELKRPLKVAINTWAGHAPGIVANGGLDVGSPASLYKKKYGLDVQFILIEDPVAKL